MVEEKKPTKIRAVQETVYSIHFRLTIFAALIFFFFFFPRPKELGKLRSPVEQQTTGWLAAQRSLEGPPERVKTQHGLARRLPWQRRSQDVLSA